MSESDTSRVGQAATWRVWLTENALEGCQELSAWLAKDARNTTTWQRIQDDWALFAEHANSPELLELRSEALAHAHEAGQRRWLRSRRCAIAHRLGIAAGIVMLAGVFFWAKQATARESGEIIFENESLTTVVARINRYAPHAVIIGDVQTGKLRISGVFHTDEVEGFVSTIAAYLPVRMEKETDGTIRLTRRSRRRSIPAFPMLTSWRAFRL